MLFVNRRIPAGQARLISKDGPFRALLPEVSFQNRTILCTSLGSKMKARLLLNKERESVNLGKMCSGTIEKK